MVARLPKSHQEAALKLKELRTLSTSGYLNQVVKTDTTGSHPDIVKFYLKFNAELKARGYPFYAFEFLRSNARQKILKAQGVSKAGPGSSPHNWGCAVDIIHSTRLWNLTEKEWAVVGTIGKEVARRMNVKIVWGGDWSFYDPAHWELMDWRAYRQAHEILTGDGSEFPGFSRETQGAYDMIARPKKTRGDDKGAG